MNNFIALYIPLLQGLTFFSNHLLVKDGIPYGLGSDLKIDILSSSKGIYEHFLSNRKLYEIHELINGEIPPELYL